MSIQSVSIRYHVKIEGAEESIKELNDILKGATKGLRLFTSLDYTFLAWEKAVKKFDIMSFMRLTISTIYLIRRLTAITQIATAAQWAYNAALAVGQALTPWGLVALGAAGAVGGGIYLGSVTGGEKKQELSERERLVEEARREAYRSVVPG